MNTIAIDGLPDDPLGAAALFHRLWLDQVRAQGTDLLLVFPPADHTHTAWRSAAVQALARDAASFRVNAVASDEPAALVAAQIYLSSAPGLTGQYLVLDGYGAGDVIGLAP